MIKPGDVLLIDTNAMIEALRVSFGWPAWIHANILAARRARQCWSAWHRHVL